jgi:ABC-type sugar transport system substrate-binding protein
MGEKMNKKIITGFAVFALLLSIGLASAQSYNIPNYYPISSNQYVQSLNNGVMQNTAYSLGQLSNLATLLPDLLAIFLVIIVVLVIWVKFIQPNIK